MKKIFFFAMLAMLTMSAKPQDTTVYQSVFGDSIAVWYENVMGSACHFPYSFSILTNDTAVIDSVVYLKCALNDFCTRALNYFHRLYNSFDTVYFRESMNHDKLYLRPKVDGILYPEYIIMDLSLDVGDTIPNITKEDYPFLSDYLFSGPFVIDSVYEVDGRKVLRTGFNNSWVRIRFMEGIGPSYGLMYTLAKDNPDFLSRFLMCYVRDDEWIYSQVEWWVFAKGGEYEVSDCCFYEIGDVATITEEMCTVYPNPTEDYLYLKFQDCYAKRILLYDNKGVVVYENNKVIVSDVQIDVRHLSKGVYTLVVESEDRLMTKKIVRL